VAVPSWNTHLARARRADAVAALMRVELAQAQFFGHHGIYAKQLGVLVGAASPRSAGGFYDISLQEVGAEGYRAAARARDEGAQAADAECRELLLVVRAGVSVYAPSRRCWNL
jgi:type IV pilus assembly protein PilE